MFECTVFLNLEEDNFIDMEKKLNDVKDNTKIDEPSDIF